MIKSSQLFGWEQEPTQERPSGFQPSRWSGSSAFAALAPFDGHRRTAAPAPRRVAPTAPEAMRGSAREGDSSLSRLVPAWLQDLPASARPRGLCAQFPRIANRLALCWADPMLAVQLLEGLLADKRGGRLGFAAEVQAELMRLRALAGHAARAQER